MLNLNAREEKRAYTKLIGIDPEITQVLLSLSQ